MRALRLLVFAPVLALLPLSTAFPSALPAQRVNYLAGEQRAGAILVARHPQLDHRDSDDDDDDTHAHVPSNMSSNSHLANAHEPPKTIYISNEVWPVSYYEHDLLWSSNDERLSGGLQHTSLITIHALTTSLAFFFALPLALALRTTRHPSHMFFHALSLMLALAGWLTGIVYKSLTPNYYPSSSHTSWGTLLMLALLVVSSVDVFAFFRRIANKRDWTRMLPALSSGKTSNTGGKEESPDEVYSLLSPQEHTEDPEGHWRGFRRDSGSTAVNDSTTDLHDITLGDPENVKPPQRRRTKLSIIWTYTLIFFQRILPVIAFTQFLSGTIVYTGSCRSHYVYGCLAHTIKGGIFFLYGIITWARFLGAWAELGWAWNVKPKKEHMVRRWRDKAPSAEAVESGVIFVYGIMNTWMERIGHSQKAWSIKDVQHVSIAVMFWFAGLCGMALESHRLRKFLSFSSVSCSRTGEGYEGVEKPPSYRGSFNPFPALVIGVTGMAMAAHHQEYLFQVEIHELWGTLLGAFALFRFLTYTFLWLRPPSSILPSRPPTEAAAAVCLTGGGIIFILSTEEVTYAAMKNGYDDVMAIANLTVAIVCAVFCWVVVVLGVKGYAGGRMRK